MNSPSAGTEFGMQLYPSGKKRFVKIGTDTEIIYWHKLKVVFDSVQRYTICNKDFRVYKFFSTL